MKVANQAQRVLLVVRTLSFDHSEEGVLRREAGQTSQVKFGVSRPCAILQPALDTERAMGSVLQEETNSVNKKHLAQHQLQTFKGRKLMALRQVVRNSQSKVAERNKLHLEFAAAFVPRLNMKNMIDWRLM